MSRYGEIPGREQARGGVTRAQLVQAAGELFRSDGYAGTSIVNVARRAGVGVATVYRHFDDKRAVLLALIDDWATRLEARQPTDLELERFVGNDPRAAIHRWLRRSCDRERKGPSLYVLVLELAESDLDVRRRYHRLEQTAIERLREFIAFGQRRGIMRGDVDVASAAFLIHHAIDMAATQILVREVREPNPERVLAELADMICRYVLEEPT